jgi:hypothetical protein
MTLIPLVGVIPRIQIDLCTRQNTRITNDTAGILDAGRIAQAKAERVRYEARGAIYRTTASAKYNCHGLTFASKRTVVDDSSLVPMILREDNYLPILNHREVLPGDVILYRNTVTRDVWHSGIVVSVDQVQGQLFMPKVCSKWGFCGEVIHWANDCPYTSGTDIEYHRIFE